MSARADKAAGSLLFAARFIASKIYEGYQNVHLL